jgi:predicted outer membrane protein
MSVWINTKTIAFAAGFSCLLAAYALAQPGTPGQPDRSNQQTMPRTGMGAMSQPATRIENPEVDRYFASCLRAQNKAEIEIGQFVEQRLQNPQLKQFSQQLIADHQAMSSKLEPLAGEQGSSDRARTETSARTESIRQPNGPQQTSYTERTTGATDRMNDQGNAALQQIAAIQKAAGDRAIENIKETLQQKQGEELEQCYLGAVIGCHVQLVAELETLKDHTAGQLQQIAQEDLPKAKQHLEKAEQLAKELAGNPSRQAGVERSTQGVPRVPR